MYVYTCIHVSTRHEIPMRDTSHARPQECQRETVPQSTDIFMYVYTCIHVYTCIRVSTRHEIPTRDTSHAGNA